MLIKRRQLLSGIGGMMAGSMCTHALRAAETSSSNLILVAIYLSGGNDGINTVIPLQQYGQYVKIRTPGTPPAGQNMVYELDQLQDLAFDPNPATPALQASNFAFAPSMVAMRDLYATGKLAVVNGIGLPLTEVNSLSHYNATLDWMTGQINTGVNLPPGWLGLTMDGVTSGSLGPSVSFSGSSTLLTGTKTAPVTINPPMDYFGVSWGVSDNQKAEAATFNGINALPALSPSGLAEQAVLEAALADISVVQALAKKEKAATYPLDTWLDYQLRDVGRMIVGGSGVRAYFVEQGGYDTHGEQMLSHPQLLQQLSQAMTNFYEYLLANNATSNVVMFTVSDFGRRPVANLDFGTDHGSASVAFAFGDPVTGGAYGAYPSLKTYDPNGNLKNTFDFRNMLSDLIVAAGGNPTPILGQTWAKIGFI